MTKKYVLYPGWVSSKTDNDSHYIGFDKLSKLYGVPLSECLVVSPYDANHYSRSEMEGRKKLEETLIALHPRRDGNYTLPPSNQAAKQPKVKYALYPGKVTTPGQGRSRHVSPGELAKLYGVSPDECVTVYQGDLQNIGQHAKVQHAKTLIPLYPKFDGDYTLPPSNQTTTASSNQDTKQPDTTLTLRSLEEAVNRLRGLPPAKWILVAPDGRVWSDEDPMQLAQVAMLSAAPQLFPMKFDLNKD